MGIRIPALAGTTIAGVLLAGMPTAQAADVQYIITNAQNCTQDTIDAAQSFESRQNALFTAACEPTLAPPWTPVPLAAYTGVGLNFYSFADASTTQTTGRDTFAIRYSVYGWVDSDDQCSYTPQLSHFESSTVTSGRRVGPGGRLTLDVDRYVAAGKSGDYDKQSGTAQVVSSIHTIAGASPQQKLCAISGAAVVWRFGGLVTLIDDKFFSSSQAKKIFPVRARIATDGMIPNPPGITGTGFSLNPGSVYEIQSTIGGNIYDGRLVSRLLAVGTASREGAPCTGTATQPTRRFDRTSKGIGEDRFPARIPNDPSLAGRYLCTYVEVLNDLGFRSTGQTTYVPIEAATNQSEAATEQPVDWAQIGAALRGALESLNSVSDPASAQGVAALAAVEQARARALEALFAGGGQNQPNQPGGAGGQNQPGAPGAGGGQVASPESVIEEIGRIDDRLDKLGVGEAPGGTAARSALEQVTGYDQSITPLLPIGVPTAAGLELNVKSPATVKRGRNMKATVSIDPGEVRGRMRLYLVRYNDAGDPALVLKRVGFIGNGSKSKTFRVPRNSVVGSYALLTTFQPTTPGQVGVSTLTPLRVTR